MSAVLRRSSLAAVLALLGVAWLVVVNDARGSGAAAATPSASGTIPNISPLPPGAPSGLQATSVRSTSVTLTWVASTPGCCAVEGYDVIYRPTSSDIVFHESTGNVTTVTITSGIGPATEYTFWVSAHDGLGHRSAQSSALTVVTPPSDPGPDPSGSSPALSCRVGISTNATWTGGFVLGLTITNTGPTPITDWTLTFSFGGDQRIVSAWSATFSQSGQAVSMAAMDWNRVIPPGGSVSVGLQGTWTGTSAPPTAFFMNGVRCALG